MKYIKSYENNKYTGEYYLIPAQPPELNIALNKLNIPEDVQKDLYLNNEGYINDNKVFININYNEKKHNKYGWMPHDDSQYKESIYFYKTHHYNYKGEIKITKKDLDDYNTKQTANKFNL
jgi:hypothetical protein